MRRGVFAGIVVAVVLVAGASTYLYYDGLSSTGLSTICTINAEGTLVFQVVNSTSSRPIAGVPVEVKNLYPDCPPNPHTTSTLGTMSTDANGTLTLGGLGEYYLTVNYHGTYSVNASIGPERATCVTLSIPSGQISTTVSGFLETRC